MSSNFVLNKYDNYWGPADAELWPTIYSYQTITSTLNLEFVPDFDFDLDLDFDFDFDLDLDFKFDFDFDFDFD